MIEEEKKAIRRQIKEKKKAPGVVKSGLWGVGGYRKGFWEPFLNYEYRCNS